MSHQASRTTGSHNLMEDMLKSPKPTHHFFLNRPLAGNGSSISVNEHAPPTTPRIRAHIGHLLPRHTYFRAKIMIHQVSSVPFVSGEFGVRWKLKGVQAPVVHKLRLLDRVFSDMKIRTADKGKGREVMGGDEVDEEGHVGSVRQKDCGAPVRAAPSHNGTSSVSSHSSASAHSQHLSASGLSSPSTNSSVLTVGASSTAPYYTLAGNLAVAPDPVSATPARGITPFLKLRDHSVVWSQLLDPILKFDVDRDTAQVLPNELKLVVMQRVIPDDPDGSPQNPRLGAVYLNLAEYIGQGSVERRYLLKESKTNATLKITIEMEYIHGELHYIPPPLAKGEILTGISGFLDNDIVKKRPRALDIYGPYKDQEELEIDLLGAPRSARLPKPKTPRTARKPSDKSQPSDQTDSDEGEFQDAQDEDFHPAVAVAFDVQRLPFAYGTKTTEALIEALFNPVRVTDKREESPFTIYEPPSAGITPRAANDRTTIGLGLSGVTVDQHATIGKRQGSMATTSSSVYSTSSSSASVLTTTTTTTTSSNSKSRSQSHSESFHGDRSTPEGRVVVKAQQEETSTTSSGHGVRGWWKKHTRPTAS